MGTEICPHCDYAFDPKLREQRRREQLQASGKKFEKWIDDISTSDKIHMKVLALLGRTAWIIYMAMLTFVIYFVALFSG